MKNLNGQEDTVEQGSDNGPLLSRAGRATEEGWVKICRTSCVDQGWLPRELANAFHILLYSLFIALLTH